MARPRLLIVSSEPLSPGNTLPSVFELAQARILKQIADVSILAVDAPLILVSRARAAASDFVRRPSTALRQGSDLLAGLLHSRRSNRDPTTHVIDGIPVYSAPYMRLRSGGPFRNSLHSWVSAAWRAHRLCVREQGAPNLVHAHGRFLNAGVFALALKKATGCPYVYTDHSTYYQRGLAPSEARPVLDMITANADAVTFVSSGLQMQVERFLGREVIGARIVPNVVDPVFEVPLAPAPSGSINVMLTVAALEEKKGIDVLLRAFHAAIERDSNIRLKIVGEGSQRQILQGLSVELGIESQVEWLGRRSPPEIRELMDQSVLFVLPSRVETFGVVVIEAMFRGCPIVATRSGGPESIVDERCGVVVESNDVAALSRGLAVAMADRQRFVRSEIRRSAEARFGSAAFLSQMRDLFSDVNISLG